MAANVGRNPYVAANVGEESYAAANPNVAANNFPTKYFLGHYSLHKCNLDHQTELAPNCPCMASGPFCSATPRRLGHRPQA